MPKPDEYRNRDRRDRNDDYQDRDRQSDRRYRGEDRRDKYSSRDRHGDNSKNRQDDRRKDRSRDRSDDRHRRRRDRNEDDSKRRYRSSNSRSRDNERNRSEIYQKDKRSTSRSRMPSTSNANGNLHYNDNGNTVNDRPHDVPLDSIEMPDDSSHESPDLLTKTQFEFMNEFSREGFEKFTRDNGIDFSTIETDEDRSAVHAKMEEHLKQHFAAQGKVYPPPKQEKPIINAATGFANDGSFIEQFKKMQEEQKKQAELEKKRLANVERLKNLPVRRRFGGKILKTGLVAKAKVNDDASEAATSDPWALYLKEVHKYKSSSCDSDSKTRPLVK